MTARSATPVAGLDLRHASERQADAAMLALARTVPPGADCWLATHWAGSGDTAHVALTVEIAGVDLETAWDLLATATEGTQRGLCLAGREDGPADLVAGARAARAAHEQRRSGRLVRFPGCDAVTGTLPVAELLDRSAVDRVRVLAAGDAAPDQPVRTRGHVRPTWSEGALVLLVQPAVGGTLVPFESPDPTPCCADHH